MILKIDNEFRDLITPLTPEEFSGLEASILKFGCMDKIKVYGDTIVDGHNRYAICKKHDIDFEVEYMGFETRADIINWIIDNQLGRRNLAPWQQSILRGKRYNAEKKDEGRPNKLYQNDTVSMPTREKLAAQFGVSPATISRDAEFAKAAEIAAQELDVPIMQLTKAQIREVQEQKIQPGYIHVSDDSYEWYTPIEYIEAARAVMGSITVDPASCEEANKIVKADTFYTKEENGLDVSWFGNVWMNPPYNMPYIEDFTRKAHSHYVVGDINQCVILVNNSTDTMWFHALLSCYPVCFTRGRVKFYGPNASQARQGQAIFYLGKNVKKFIDEFSKFGIVTMSTE